MSRIYEDHNGLAVNAISSLSDGTDVEGRLYQILAGSKSLDVEFQQGPVTENGVNGATNESLLAILIHRLEHLESEFPCYENRISIKMLREALMWLEARTRDRAKRIDGGIGGGK